MNPKNVPPRQSVGKNDNALPVEVELDGNTITLRLARAVFVSEGNCRAITGVEPGKWARTLKRWGVPFIKTGHMHTARIEDVEAAIDGLSRARPTPTSEVKRAPQVQAAAIVAQLRGAR